MYCVIFSPETAMKNSAPLALLLLALSTSAASPTGAASPEPPDEAALLLQLDRDFDAASARDGAEAWVAYFGDYGAILQPTASPLSGPDALRAAMVPVFTTPGSSLRWQPTRAEILIPGALGYTLGRYQRRRSGNDGRPMVQHGTYFTLWRKQPGGSWKIAADTGQPDGPFQPAE
jgi:ketosteroid isomerase-like protein